LNVKVESASISIRLGRLFKDGLAVTQDALRLSSLSALEQLRYGREIVQLEAQALDKLSRRLDGGFCRAVEYLHQCRGSVIVTGIGKAGLIGQKISATLASTGTRSIFLHPVEALHGDLGRVQADDVVLALSQSGETSEVLRLLPALEKLSVPVIACPLGLAPSTSTTAMLAVGDALALVTSRMLAFGHADFARVHPAGQLGLVTSCVDDHMRILAECRVANEGQTVREVFAELRRPGRRSGAIMLVRDDGALSGLFTDSDLARLFEARRDAAFDQPIREVMTVNPRTVVQGSMLTDAVAIMAERKISELPVIDATHAPAGLLDITDLVGMIPEEPR
jgi:arabinose-5-phosphate isomerase